MFIDGRKIPKDTTLNCDICVVGAGAVGITLARELEDSGLNVILIESGGFTANPDTDRLKEGKNIGLNYSTSVTRGRFFGGSMNLWSWYNHPLDKSDFEKRDWIPYSGWPITKKELDPYYKRASTFMGLSEKGFNPEKWESSTFKRLPLDKKDFETIIVQLGLDENANGQGFTKMYKESIERSKSIRTILNSNVTDFEIAPSGKDINRSHVKCLNGNYFYVQAKYYVLGAGGIENPRLLLNATKQQKNGIGNQNDLVGRFFMEHPHFDGSGYFLLSNGNQSTGMYRHPTVDKHKMTAVLHSSEEFRKKNRLNNYLIFPMGHPKEGILKTTARWLLNREINITRDQLKKWEELNRAYKFTNSIISTQNPSTNEPATLEAWMEEIEQRPNPNSRITLSNDTDALGLKKVILDWRMEEEDWESLRAHRKLLGKAFARKGIGRYRETKQPEEYQPRGGAHHMGTTRMHEDPHQGVVDGNLAIHGMNNIFISGASVFTTSGAINPTFTIIALTIRLADHLKEIA